MAKPASRTELKDWCLRRLGSPTLDVNVTDDQLEDRIDEAIGYFQEYHYDGSEKVFVARKITSSLMTFAAPTVGTFAKGEIVVGAASKATATVLTNQLALNQIDYILNTTNNPFFIGELVTGASSGATGVISNFIPGDVDNHWIPVPPDVISVRNVLPLSGSYGVLGQSGNVFSAPYQELLNDFRSGRTFDAVSMTIYRQYYALLSDIFAGEAMLRFNKNQNRVYLDIDWKHNVQSGNYLILECLKSLDPDAWSEVYNDNWVRKYATALIKEQWGLNLQLFSGVNLVGSISLNADKIVEQALKEKEDLEKELERRFQLPPEMLVG